MLGNFALGGSASWGEGCVTIPKGSYLINSGSIVPSETGEYTVSIAFKVTAISTSGCYLISQGINVSSDMGLIIIVLSPSNINANIRYGTTSGAYTTGLKATKTIAVGDKLVIDVVCTGTKFSLYVNGQLATEYSNTFTKWTDDWQKLGICCRTNKTGYNSDSKLGADIYAINVYDRALTPEEVLQNFENYNTRFNLGL